VVGAAGAFLGWELSIGVYLPIGQHHDAADSLRTGIAGLPPDQRHAGWMDEYQQALDRAEAQTDAPPIGQAE